MGGILLEIVVGVALALIGALVMYLFVGDGVWNINPDWLYALGALVVSVPAIIVLERRRRRPY